jgi:hypothetical protein
VARPHKPTPEKFCAFCKKKMERNSLKNGGLEALFFFKRRKFCNRSCVAKALSARATAERVKRGPIGPNHRARDMTPAQREARKLSRNTPEQRAKRNVWARERRKKNPAEVKAVNKKWRLANRDKISISNRIGQVKFRYGITVSDRDAMVAAQGGGCAICGREMKPPHVDHCHETGKIRGILCRSCNSGLGQFHDSAELLLLAVLYLARRRQTE